MADEQELYEAPASTTYSITSKGGFNILFTVRATAGLDLLDTMESIEKKLITLGYKPQPARGASGGYVKKEIEYVEGELCPICHARLVKKVTKDGKEYHPCENNKYDFVSKRNIGSCDYIDWMK